MLNFTWKVKKSFKNVKRDIDSLRQNVNEWVVYLDGKEEQIEKRLDKIEDRMDRLEEAMFRILAYDK
jgi:uncharacterized protein Yka (UPF0111/DUF47 family)